MPVPPEYKSLLEKVPCNLCGRDDYDIIYPSNYELANPQNIDTVFRSSGDEILFDQLVRCKNCHLMYLNPRLKQDIILNGYSSGEDPLFVSQVPAREATFRRSWRQIRKLRPQPGRILDIGTASGAFLKVVKDDGWDVTGCEPNHWMTKWCKDRYGIDVFDGTVFGMNLPPESFDIVSLWDVLEHTPDPTKILKECHRVLKKGGLLIVNYPDIGSWVSGLMGRRWVFLLSIHLYYFTPQTIRTLLSRSGFKTLTLKPHWQSLELAYIFLRMKAYIPWVGEFGQKAANFLKIDKLAIPYWMGQTLVLAKKN